MRICFITESITAKNGWGVYARDLIGAVRAQGIECTVLTSHSHIHSGDPAPFEKRLLGSPKSPFKTLQNARRIKSIIQANDCVHILQEPYLAHIYPLKGKVPVVMTAHGTSAVEPLDKGKLRSLRRSLYPKLDALICVSNFTKQEVLKRIPNTSVAVIPNGINLKHFNMAAKSHSAGDSFSGKRLILSVGTLKSRKGYHIAIEAIARLRDQFSNIAYCIVGSTENKTYTQTLKDLIRKLQIENVVIIKGESSDDELAGLYAAADVFVLTSINTAAGAFEGFGLVYLEAGLHGLPVIGTRGNGSEEAIQEGRTGLLVPQNDIEATAAAIGKLLADRAKAKAMGAQGKAYAQSQSWNAIAPQYIQVYRKAMKQEGS